jgi:hypothetical protein
MRSANKGIGSATAPGAGSLCATALRTKKTVRADEQDRPDILSQCGEWFENQPDLKPARLVFIDG